MLARQLRGHAPLRRAVEEAQLQQELAKERGDEYVSTEHLLIGIASDDEAGQVLRDAGATPERLVEALSQVRGGGRITSPDPEGTFQALEKYGDDLTARAREGKIDPVIRCVEPAACPTLTKGEYRYDFGDTAKMAEATGLVDTLVDRDGEKKLTRKPIALGVGLLFFLGFLTFWAVGARVDSVPAEAEIEMRILEERVIPPRTGLEAGGDTETPQP